MMAILLVALRTEGEDKGGSPYAGGFIFFVGQRAIVMTDSAVECGPADTAACEFHAFMIQER